MSPPTSPVTTVRKERPRTSRSTRPSIRTTPPNPMRSLRRTPGSSTTMEAEVTNTSPTTSPDTVVFTATPRSAPPIFPVSATVTVPDDMTWTLPVISPRIVRSPVKMVRSPSMTPSTTALIEVTY